MKSIAIFTVLALTFGCALSLDVLLNQHWNSWKQANNKLYSDAQEHIRFVLLDLQRLLVIYAILVVLYGKII